MCALLERCRALLGRGGRGGLGYGNVSNLGDDESVATVGDVVVGGTVIQLSVGAQHTCAVLDNGHVRCWGDNQSGILGYGGSDAIGDDELPDSAGNVPVF